MWLSSDVGKPREELATKFQGWDFSEIPAVWWHTNENWKDEPEWRKPGQYVCPGEPEEEFTKRMIQFKEWLQGRHESRIAVVAHWGVIYALSGRSMRNCEAAWFSLDDLMRKEILVTD
mmetsp:Transcript_23925/g.37471  ORF Transcript_23925/g.37471 Transcript_23925/m.37471 type:complete len:118 (+) Transcript_23925:424-777(+)